MDPTSVSAALSAGSQIVTLLKALKDKIHAGGKAEVIGDLLEVQASMMDVLQKQQSLIDENAPLRQELAQLKSLFDQREHVEIHYDLYWIRQQDESLDGPFSPVLWDTKQQLVRMVWDQAGKFDGVHKISFYCRPTNEPGSVPVDFLRANSARQLKEHGLE